MPPSLNVDLAPGHKTGLQLRNPVLTASGTFSWGLEFSRHFAINELGGMVSKGVTREPRAGNRQPRVAQTPGGMLNSIGLQNIGIDHVIDDMAPIWKTWDLPAIVNIAGETIDEFGEMAAMLDGTPGVAALELNISCPNVENGMDIGQDASSAARATRAAVRNTTLPVIVSCGLDAVEFLMAGASAVQVGTATFANPRAPLDVLDELTAWLSDHGVEDVNEIIGCAHPQPVLA